MPPPPSPLIELLGSQAAPLLAGWLDHLRESRLLPSDPERAQEMERRCRRFLAVTTSALNTGIDTRADGWDEARRFLAESSREAARDGLSATATASFVLSLKKPLFDHLARICTTPAALADAVWRTTELIDQLALHASDEYRHSREEIILRQQQDLLELSTPVVKLWDGILALPIIGTLDSARTQVVMESLLMRIVETGCEVAIIDITGVATVDTMVAQHLIKTVNAARLMGADCIISGIRPQIAQTIVHLGIDLSNIVTKANLSDAFRVALSRSGQGIVRRSPGPVAEPR